MSFNSHSFSISLIKVQPRGYFNLQLATLAPENWQVTPCQAFTNDLIATIDDLHKDNNEISLLEILIDMIDLMQIQSHLQLRSGANACFL
jgi:hypothetical protein